MQLSPNQKIFSQFFSPFPESTWNLEYFQKKDEFQNLFVSEIIDCRKRGYLNAAKSHVSEHLLTVNMLKAPKYCINVHRSIFVIFFDHSEKKSARKICF